MNWWKRLHQLDISNLSTSGTKIINRIDDSSKMSIEELEKIFKTNENLQHIKMHNYQPKPKTRNYYLKPTLLDIQYKERGQQYQPRYDGEAIYEWIWTE